MTDWKTVGLSGSYPAQLLAAIVRRYDGLTMSFEGHRLAEFSFSGFGSISARPTHEFPLNTLHPPLDFTILDVQESQRETLACALISAQNRIKRDLVHVHIRSHGQLILSAVDNWDRSGVFLSFPQADSFGQWLVDRGIVRRTYLDYYAKPPLEVSYRKSRQRPVS